MQESIAERKRNFAVIVNFSSAAALDYALEEELFVRVSFDQILNQLHFLKYNLGSILVRSLKIRETLFIFKRHSAKHLSF